MRLSDLEEALKRKRLDAEARGGGGGAGGGAGAGGGGAGAGASGGASAGGNGLQVQVPEETVGPQTVATLVPPFPHSISTSIRSWEKHPVV